MKRAPFVALLSAFLIAGCASEEADTGAAVSEVSTITMRGDGFTQFIPYVPRARIDAAETECMQW